MATNELSYESKRASPQDVHAVAGRLFPSAVDGLYALKMGPLGNKKPITGNEKDYIRSSLLVLVKNLADRGGWLDRMTVSLIPIGPKNITIRVTSISTLEGDDIITEESR